ncbi:MAG: aminotransferase class III-fold pyridoxal phosphate-dependent enzyme [Halobacteriales archaeon]|nr:aminotransferase class III-fold pyridoxal phosphate-dependent enzyme [Halobacteriales archaeon]
MASDGDTRRSTADSDRHHQDARSVFPGGVSHNVRYASPHPIYIDAAEGATVTDVDGNTYVDFWNNHGASLLGHAHPDVVEAVQTQAANGLHYGALNEAALELGQRIQSFVPSAERVRFCASGTEATMYAVRLARAATGRDRVMKARGGWHGGNTDLSVGVYPPFDAPTTDGLPPGPADHVDLFDVNDADSVAEQLERHGEDVAALIIDPRRGGTEPTDEFLSFLEDMRETYGFQLLFDEVVTGFRVSPGSYQARVDITPDLTTLGKIPGGGLPIGALAGRADLFDPARPDIDVPADERVLAGGGTFTMNPMTAVAGNTTLGIIDTEPVYDHTEGLAADLRAGLADVFADAGIDAEVLGLSSLVTVGFNPTGPLTSPAAVKANTDSDALKAFHRRLLDHGYYFNPGSMGNVSYAHTREHIDGLIDAASSVVASMQADGLV